MSERRPRKARRGVVDADAVADADADAEADARQQRPRVAEEGRAGLGSRGQVCRRRCARSETAGEEVGRRKRKRKKRRRGRRKRKRWVDSS